MDTIKVINRSNNPLPQYKSVGASGMDIQASLENPVVIEPFSRVIIPTGLFFEVPKGYEIQVRPRSGLAFNSGITVLNSPGTIDSDYRGEVKVILYNSSEQPFTIYNGDRIAQIVVAKVERLNLESADVLSETERGEGGFGHTGI